jgi:hypothetical protein
MMMKYAAKFALDILPSLVATILGAYIVNHYMVSNSTTTTPVAAAMSAILGSNSKAKGGVALETVKLDAKPSETSDVSNFPEPGVKAKGISEKAILEKAAVERPQERSQEALPEKAAEKVADKPAETASIPPDTRRHQPPPPPPREKTAVRTVPVPAIAPVASTANSAAPVEAAVAPEERRDANDLARAAIERLRAGNEGSPRPQEAARVQEVPRVASAPAVQPLPPPIVVATPPAQLSARLDDPLRPTPPADIPPPRPLDLRADASEPAARDHTTVADDMLSAAKSVFQAVLPK